MFNPYTEWLGLPPETSRPDYFELLQLPPEQATPAAVAAAVNAAIVRVRGYRPGPHAKQWAALIDELKQAKHTLVSPRAIERYRQQLEGETTKAWRGTPKTPKPDPQVKKSPKRIPHPPSGRDEFDPMAPVPVPLEDFLKAATPPTRAAASRALPNNPAQASTSSTPQAAPPAEALHVPELLVQAELDHSEDLSRGSPDQAEPGASDSRSAAAPPSPGDMRLPSHTPIEAAQPAHRRVSDQPVFVKSVDHPARRTNGFPWAVVACVTVLLLLAGLLVVQVSGLFNDTQPIDAVTQNSQAASGSGGRDPQATSRGSAKASGSPTSAAGTSTDTSKRPWASRGQGLDQPAEDPNDEKGPLNDELGGPLSKSATEKDGADEPEERQPAAEEAPPAKTADATPNVASDVSTDSPGSGSDPLVARADTIRFGDYLMAARQSLHDRELDAAREQLVQMEDMPARPGDQAMRLRLLSLLGLVEQFWDAVERGAGTLKSAQELTFDAEGNIKIIIVEVNPGPVITYRVGERREEPMWELPTEVAMLIAQEVLAKDDPDALRMRGAFYAIESLGKPALTEKAIALWQEAEQMGADVGDLRLYLEDDYNLVNSLVERSPIPNQGELRAAETGLRAEWAERRQGVNTAEERAALANAFARAAPREDSPVNRYLLFQEALEWAGRSGQPELAVDICHQMAQWFEVENLLVLEADVLLEVAKSDGGEDAAREAATKVVELADQIVDDEKSLDASKDRLEQLFQAALTAARRTRDRDFQIEIRKAINDVREKFEPAGVLR